MRSQIISPVWLLALAAGCIGEVPGHTTGEQPDAAVMRNPDPPADAPTYGPAGWTLTPNDVGLAKLGKTCNSLPLYTGTLQPVAGTTLSDVRIVGSLRAAGTLTLERVCVVGSITGSRVIVRNSEIVGGTPTDRGFDGDLIEITDSYIHDVSVGIWFGNSVGSNKRVIIENNVIRANSIAIESQDFYGTDVTAMIRGNHLISTTSESYYSAFTLLTAAGDIANITLERNLIECQTRLTSITLAGRTMSNLVARDNRFIGGTNVASGASWQTWEKNYMFSASGTDGIGSSLAAP